MSFHSSTNAFFEILLTLFNQTMNSFRLTLHSLSMIHLSKQLRNLSTWQESKVAAYQCEKILTTFLYNVISLSHFCGKLSHTELSLCLYCISVALLNLIKGILSIAKCGDLGYFHAPKDTFFPESFLLAWITRCRKVVVSKIFTRKVFKLKIQGLCWAWCQGHIHNKAWGSIHKSYHRCVWWQNARCFFFFFFINKTLFELLPS